MSESESAPVESLHEETTSVSVEAPAAPATVDPVILISSRNFIQSLKGTPDEVYSKVLTMLHRDAKHSPADWRKTLEEIRATPVKH